MTKLTKKEFEILRILWESGKPYTVSEFYSAHSDLAKPTIAKAFKTLTARGYIKGGSFVQSKTNFAQAFSANLTKEEFLQLRKNQLSSSPNLLFNTLWKAAPDKDELLDDLSALLDKYRKQSEASKKDQ